MNGNVLCQPSLRYSDEDLAIFKQAILDKLKKVQYDLFEAKSSCMNPNGVDDTSPVFKAIDEESSETTSKAERDINISRLIKFIYYLESALVRIENKTYGVCKVSGTLIPRERLLSVPHTSLSIGQKN